MRTIQVPERVYGILKYGAMVYNESMGNFLERFIDGFASKENAKKLISHLELEISQISHSVGSEHLEMIKEGFGLIREFSLEKAKELEDRLTQIKSEISHLET